MYALAKRGVRQEQDFVVLDNSPSNVLLLFFYILLIWVCIMTVRP